MRLARTLEIGETAVAEVLFATLAVLRATVMLTLPGAFSPGVREALVTVAPTWVWAVAYGLPGVLQLVAVVRGGRARRFAAGLNAGLMVTLTVASSLAGMGDNALVFYGSLAAVQLFFVIRLSTAVDPPRRRRTDWA